MILFPKVRLTFLGFFEALAVCLCNWGEFSLEDLAYFFNQFSSKKLLVQWLAQNYRPSYVCSQTNFAHTLSLNVFRLFTIQLRSRSTFTRESTVHFYASCQSPWDPDYSSKCFCWRPPCLVVVLSSVQTPSSLPLKSELSFLQPSFKLDLNNHLSTWPKLVNGSLTSISLFLLC